MCAPAKSWDRSSRIARPRPSSASSVASLVAIAVGASSSFWDNLNIHHEDKDARWTRFNERHGGRFQFVHTPVHASWVNQIELWFSILERRVLRRASFDHAVVLRREVEAFIRYWNHHEKKPFRWTFDGRFDHTRRRAA